MSSECGHNQNPRKILQAINDTRDKGNRFDREIFQKDESKQARPRIACERFLQAAKQVIKEEIRDYFINHQPEINWTNFWEKCEREQ